MRLYDNDAYREEFMAIVYGLLASDETNDRANQIIDAFDVAPTVEAEPLLPNDPLTLDELRVTDGEPVFIYQAYPPEYGMDDFWGIVDADREMICHPIREVLFREVIGGVYRRRPEKERRNV